MSKVEGISKILSGVGRAMGRGGDDALRGGGRLAPRVGAVGAAGAGIAGAGWLVSSALSGNNRNVGNGGNNAPATMGGGGLSGQRAGVASSRGFTAPSNDNSPSKVSYNPNGKYETESLKLQAHSANSLSSIDNTVKNILKFSVAKATWDTRSLRELAIESSGGGGMDPSAAAMAAANAGGGGNANASMPPALIAGLAAVAGGLYALSKLGGGSNGSPGSSPGGMRLPDVSPGSPLGQGLHQAGMGLTGAAYAGDARRMVGGRPSPAAPPGVAANDNRRSLGSRARAGMQRLDRAASTGRLGSALTSMAGSASSRGVMRVAQFLKGLKATPVGRFPYVTSVFAAIDPIIAAVESGGQVNDSVKKELVGAIATIIAGPAGIALGAALGAFVGIPATPVGMAVGAILGGIGGAVAALSAEFVAEQMYDLITGKISMGQFARNLGRGAMNGVRNTAAIAGGAALGGIMGGARFIGRGVSAVRAAAPAVAPAATRGGLRLVAPTGRSVVGLAVAGGVGGAALIASQPRAPSAGANAPPAAMNLQGSELHTAARTAAEQYLGRGMTTQEWDALLRTVYAESGRGGAGRENAMIMATILNRARNAARWSNGNVAQAYLRSGLTVLAVLYSTNQFQAVTGTRNNRRPSAMYSRGPNQNELNEILRSAVQFLHKVPHGQTNFTAAASGAYGAGTNIGYRDAMLAGGGVVVGGTVFNTSMMGENQAQTATPAPAPSPGVSPTAGMAPPANQGVLARLGAALTGFGRGGGAPSPAQSGDEGASASTAAGATPAPTGPALETLRRYNLKDESHISGLKGPFADKMARFLHAANSAGKTIKINSGYRSVARQAQLYAAAVRKYGAAGARRWVAPPGASKHNHGLAVDLVYGPNLSSTGSGSAASRDAKMWAHANAARFGLNFRMGHEPWHVEPTGASIPANAGAAAHAALPRTGGGRNEALGAGAARSIAWTSAAPGATPSISGGSTAAPPSPVEGISPSTPEARLAENIVASSIAAEKKRLNVVVQSQTDQSNGKTIKTRNEKTDSGAPESVSSPVMAAYEYAAYWGVD